MIENMKSGTLQNKMTKIFELTLFVSCTSERLFRVLLFGLTSTSLKSNLTSLSILGIFYVVPFQPAVWENSSNSRDMFLKGKVIRSKVINIYIMVKCQMNFDWLSKFSYIINKCDFLILKSYNFFFSIFISNKKSSHNANFDIDWFLSVYFIVFVNSLPKKVLLV